MDCWNSETGEPIIYHGHTLTSKLLFADVCEAIKESAFLTSPYPVVLSIENHCDIPHQKRMAEILVQVFGGSFALLCTLERLAHSLMD